MRAKFLDTFYVVEFVPKSELGRNRGLCDAPSEKKPKIMIQENLPPKTEMEVTIHEALHALDWWKSEEWVERAGDDLTRLLWRLGYRRNHGL